MYFYQFFLPYFAFQHTMASNVFGAKKFKPTPPDKGSFPLDHEGECKQFYLKYMECLSDNERKYGKCKPQSKDYLNCRMQKGLMANESWPSLGFSESEVK